MLECDSDLSLNFHIEHNPKSSKIVSKVSTDVSFIRLKYHMRLLNTGSDYRSNGLLGKVYVTLLAKRKRDDAKLPGFLIVLPSPTI